MYLPANHSALKILLISSRADYGGGPEHIWQLMNHSDPKLKFYVACPKDIPYWSRFHQLISPCRLCDLPHREFRLNALVRLISFIRTHEIQLVHSHGKGAGIYGRLAAYLSGIPCVHTPHGIHVDSYGAIKKVLYRLYENITGFRLNHILFVSKSEHEQAVCNGLWPKISYRIVNNGVNTFTAEKRNQWRQQVRKTLALPDDVFVIASLSRFDFAKNMEEAYLIAQNCPKMLFLWIGDGEDKKTLEEKSQKKGIKNIIFTGFTETPAKFLAASDAYLSTSRWEGMPLGVLEAMSSGLPVVATEVSGNRDVVAHEKTGLCYPLGKIDLACDYLTNLANDQNLYDRLSSESIRIQKKLYSVKTMADKIQNLYQEIINDRPITQLRKTSNT